MCIRDRSGKVCPILLSNVLLVDKGRAYTDKDLSLIHILRCYGVNTEYVQRGGNRLGIYYCENGASQRPSKVIYDRAGSSIAEVEPGEFDWQRIFEGAAWFPVSYTHLDVYKRQYRFRCMALR